VTTGSGGFADRPAAKTADTAEGELRVGRHRLLAISDGYFEVDAEFLGSPEHPTAGHEALKDENDEVAVPLGCFLMPGPEPLLIDLGLGPHERPGWDIALSGGRLLSSLRVAGFGPEDIRTIALSHLHVDHIGWLCDSEGVPTFANARVLVSAADWDYFVDGPEPNIPLDPPVRHALETLAAAGRIEFLDGDRQIAPGLTRLAAPGHTPGHSLFAVHDGPERALLLGADERHRLGACERRGRAPGEGDQGPLRRHHGRRRQPRGRLPLPGAEGRPSPRRRMGGGLNRVYGR
jgi:glyoxylase-like metal-dependent hydrolase (beta-lactamase superfamily II)